MEEPKKERVAQAEKNRTAARKWDRGKEDAVHARSRDRPTRRRRHRPNNLLLYLQTNQKKGGITWTATLEKMKDLEYLPSTLRDDKGEGEQVPARLVSTQSVFHHKENDRGIRAGTETKSEKRKTNKGTIRPVEKSSKMRMARHRRHIESFTTGTSSRSRCNACGTGRGREKERGSPWKKCKHLSLWSGEGREQVWPLELRSPTDLKKGGQARKGGGRKTPVN